jgi:hypothetical protein
MDQMGIRTLSPDEIPEKHNWNNQETWDMEWGSKTPGGWSNNLGRNSGIALGALTLTYKWALSEYKGQFQTHQEWVNMTQQSSNNKEINERTLREDSENSFM